MRLFLLFIYLTTALSCSAQTQSEALVNPSETASEEILIVYLSRTKNTKAVAEMIQEKVEGVLVSLELETPYPEDYDAIVAQVAKENETGILPPLETEVDVSQYRTVFVGFPTWGMQLPPPMKTFLSENDLSGKMVIPFNTNAGYGIGSSFDKVEELCPESTILEGYSTRGGIERDGVLFVMEGEKEEEVKTEVDAWLGRLGF
ncbi:flavodoxin family protein [Cyclobacterium amurskyense]|uniref:flavodoxin family protein n=1 Tax=Cyclobacterium amurskyense TaxID=320787 RepID=UPI0030DABC3A|tara:strand:+ start:3677 stop:4285 length:609 start_codon:yes stop_codon:yes gene_type:complete